MIDLHAHSNASDGSDTPARLLALAAEAGLSALALTDHDTIEGLAEAQAAADRHGVRLVPGCELSCVMATGTMHLLVYFLPDSSGPLQDRLAALQAGRLTRNARIAATLTGHGLPVTEEEIMTEAGAGSVGRPHIAAVLLRKGYVNSIQEAFDQWLAYGKPAYFAREQLTAADAISLAHASGAVAVLAHPTTLGLESASSATGALEAFVGELATLGLDGVECEYGRYTPEQRAAFRAMAQRHGLCVTGGSDYHGTYKPDLAIGTGTGDLAVPDELLTQLEARRPA